MAKEKVNYQEVYDLYQLCCETKDFREFCSDYGVNYDKFMNWQRHQLWNEKLGKAVQTEQPKVAKVQIISKSYNSPTVSMEVKQPEGEPPIKWGKLQLASGATLFLRNTTVLDLMANEEKAGLRKQVNELMRKAANYTINQWKSLRNILKDGSAEISNNLCEQRMKPVKLLLKNCMNIGSEDAAGNSAFIISLIESCKLNDIDPQDYLKHLFECILHGKDCDKKALLPCFYKSEC